MHFILEAYSGRYHSLILASSGDLLSFGSGQQGQLGHGSNVNEKHPKKVDFFEAKGWKVGRQRKRE
jgi:alpha-tubulin suppressor-like RCC1 family protein